MDVLTRFRQAPIALSADISEMFLQVGISSKDRPYHRFLWREFDNTRDPDVYEFSRVLFGNTASPFCAQFILQTHAQEHSATYPSAAVTVDNSMYVDDVLDSCETVEEARKLRQQLSELVGGAGFKLRKWSSNEVSVIEDIPPEDRLSSLEITGALLPTQKTLGVLWKADKDVFSFQAKAVEPCKTPTKRNVLSGIARLFDPLQFLAPFTVRAKILMQDLWAAGCDWDEIINEELSIRWTKWLSEIPDLSTFEIPRCLRLPDPTDVQLHVFSDASKHAYASAAYLVCQYADCLPTSRLVASKNRLAPLKVMSIPRLELMGAVLSTRLAKGITDVIAVNKTVFWTDSTNVCYWVRNPSRNFKPFVANRSVKYTTLQTLNNGDMFQERSTMLTYPQEEWWHLN